MSQIIDRSVRTFFFNTAFKLCAVMFVHFISVQTFIEKKNQWIGILGYSKLFLGEGGRLELAWLASLNLRSAIYSFSPRTIWERDCAYMAARQGKLDSFVKKTGGSPIVRSGPIRHAAAFKDARHSPMSKPGGSSVSCGDRDDGSHTGRSARQTEGTATSSIHSQGSTFSPLETGRQNPPAASRKVSEVKGDLFSCPSSASLAHCVSEDMHMGKGIATLFKQKFGGVGELKSQGKLLTPLAIISPTTYV